MTCLSVSTQTLTNPLLEYGPDPWAIYHDGFYYYMHSTRTDLTIWKTRDLADLHNAECKTVWTAPKSGPNARNIWSPELHCLDGRWYIYFSADDDRGQNNQRMWVLATDHADPLAGQWSVKARLQTPEDKWAVDGTVFTHKGIRYFAWSGWEDDDNTQQNIYLCRLENPWTCVGDRVKLTSPTLEWERHNYDPNQANPRNDIFVTEGPSILEKGSRLFLIYSASGCWTDEYCLGRLELAVNGDPMDADAWTKYPEPVFRTSVENSVYGPGHNCFLSDAEGTDWLLYHANPGPGKGCENERTPRLQPIRWRPDSTPDFGIPGGAGQPIPRPAVADKT